MTEDGLAEEILARTGPGTMSLVVGRPASGVSRVLAGVARAAAADAPPRPVLASWERPASGSRQLLGSADACVPEILGWSVDELARCDELVDAPEATVVCVDYLQLVGDAAAVASGLRELATNRRWRVVAGAMAPRLLRPPDRTLRSTLARGAVEDVLPGVTRSADDVFALAGGAGAG